jgi:hypothetical protein
MRVTMMLERRRKVEGFALGKVMRFTSERNMERTAFLGGLGAHLVDETSHPHRSHLSAIDSSPAHVVATW